MSISSIFQALFGADEEQAIEQLLDENVSRIPVALSPRNRDELLIIFSLSQHCPYSLSIPRNDTRTIKSSKLTALDCDIDLKTMKTNI